MADHHSQTDKVQTNAPNRGPGGPGMHFEKPKNLQSTAMRLFGYLLPYKTTLIIVIILVVLFTLISLLGPYLAGVAIDKYIIPKDLVGLARISLIMLASFLANALLMALSGWLMAGIAQTALNRCAPIFLHIYRNCHSGFLTKIRQVI